MCSSTRAIALYGCFGIAFISTASGATSAATPLAVVASVSSPTSSSLAPSTGSGSYMVIDFGDAKSTTVAFETVRSVTGIDSLRDGRPLLLKGKHQPGTVTVVRKVDGVSPRLSEALTSRHVFPQITLVLTDRSGHVLEKSTLKTAMITKITIPAAVPPNEELQIQFDTLTTAAPT